MTLPETSAPARPQRDHARHMRPSSLRGLGAAVAVALAGSALIGLATAAPAGANPAMPHDPIGALEHVTAAKGGQFELTGWAADPDATTNATIHALVDGQRVASTTTSVARPSVAKKHHTGPTPGFDFLAAVPKTGVHTLCVTVVNIGAGTSRMLGCRVTPLGTSLSSAQVAAHSPYGAISGVRSTKSSIEVDGWAAEPDWNHGRIVTVLYVDGSPAKTVDTHRATAAQVQDGAGPRGAFDISVPATAGAHMGCIWAVNTGLGSNAFLGCSPVDTRGPAGTGTVKTPTVNKTVVKRAKTKIGRPVRVGRRGTEQVRLLGTGHVQLPQGRLTRPRARRTSSTPPG